jgi:hypothetical protein
MLPISKIESAVVGLVIRPLPCVEGRRAIIVISGMPLAPACVVRKGIQNDEIEAMITELIQERIDGREPWSRAIERPQPVTLIPHWEKTCAVFVYKLRRMIGINAQATVRYLVLIGYTQE